MWTKILGGIIGVATWLAMSYLLWVGLNFDGIKIAWAQALLFGFMCTLLALGMVVLFALAINLAEKLDLDGSPSVTMRGSTKINFDDGPWGTVTHKVIFCPRCGALVSEGEKCSCAYSRGSVAGRAEMDGFDKIDWQTLIDRVEFCSACGCMVIGESVCHCGFIDTRRPSLRGEPN